LNREETEKLADVATSRKETMAGLRHYGFTTLEIVGNDGAGRFKALIAFRPHKNKKVAILARVEQE
jgi:hypothetical protein